MAPEAASTEVECRQSHQKVLDGPSPRDQIHDEDDQRNYKQQVNQISTNMANKTE
jgi:hypothetical protein